MHHEGANRTMFLSEKNGKMIPEKVGLKKQS